MSVYPIPNIINAIQPPPADTTSMLVNYAQFADDPAKVTGELTRKQWADYQARFVPTENRLMNMTSYMNPSVVSSEIAKAIGGWHSIGPAAFENAYDDKGYVNRAIDSSAAQTQRSFARYGLAPNAAQQTALDRDTSLTRSKAVVDAANRIRTNIMDRNQQIATGAVPNAGRAYGLKVEA